MADLACVAHVHSTCSDGSATVGELLAAVRDAGADALLLTDHDTLQARRDGWEGRHDGVLLVVGHEVSRKTGHLLVFGADEEIAHHGRTEPEILAAARAAGGLTIAAHPFSQGSSMARWVGLPHPWTALDDRALDGVELWSMTTDAAESWTHPGEALAGLRAPEALDGPPPRHLRIWDDLCRRRRVVGFGGLDAHQPGPRIGGRVRSIMPHARWFSLLRTHVLCATDTPEPAELLDAVRAGRCYLALDHLGDPRGFAFAATDGARRVEMGDGAPPGDWTLETELPHPAELRVLRDGREIARHADVTRLRHPATEAGAWRVEAHRAGRTWIVSNPIYLR